MAIKLIVVPIIRPAKPMIAIITFLIIKITRDAPDVEFHSVQHSRNAGSVKPNVDNVNAPINDINRSKLGTAIANKTETENKNLL